MRLLAGLLATALLAGCATDATSGSPDDTAAAGAAPPAPACEKLPERPAPPGAEALPPLSLACLGPGPAVSLDRLTGRPTLVNLWATWCGPCREEMPVLQEAYARHGERVRFLGVDVQDDPEAARWFLADLGIGYPHVVDPAGELLRELGVRGLPVTLVLDEEGRVVDRSVGQLDAESLEELIGASLP
jgi:cytochrome c biogenesis protein CcmG/thiol:disulfide interchange protein DsbE